MEQEASLTASMCALCHKSAEDSQKCPVCVKCRLAEYCCRGHQRDDWQAAILTCLELNH
jgi:hypothetical protein